MSGKQLVPDLEVVKEQFGNGSVEVAISFLHVEMKLKNIGKKNGQLTFH